MAIRKYKPEDFPFLNYELDEEQLQFTRLPKYSIAERNDWMDSSKIPVTILFEEQPVGYFVLDEGKDIFTYTQNKNSVLIRSLSLNPDFQGKGIAKQAMLDITGFVKKHFNDKDELVLAVNFRNKNAYNIYRKCNFEDYGDVVEGRIGPQHILFKEI